MRHEHARRRIRGALLAFASASAAMCLIALGGRPALAQTPPAAEAKKAPVLRIESPFAGPIWRIDVNRDETRLVASSSYKAVSVWPLAETAAPRILRVPLRDEQRRRAHGVAISPDGEWIAYGVPPLAETNGKPLLGTARIYILRETSGEIARTIETDVATRPQALKFSPDGAYLAAVLSGGCGLRVWETKTWTLASADDEGYAIGEAAPGGCGNGVGDTTGVAFAGSPEAPLLITAGDTGVRTYAFDGGKAVRRAIASPAAIGLERPEGVAVSPDGRSVAVGDRRTRGAERFDAPVALRVAVVAADTLKPLRPPYELTMASPALEHPGYLDPAQTAIARLFNLSRVAWIKDGDEEWIIAGGFFACEAGRRALRSPPPATRQDACLVRWSATRPDDEPRFIPHGTDRAIDLAVLKEAKTLVVATQKAILAMGFDGGVASTPTARPVIAENMAADFRDSAKLFNISADGGKVAFEDYASQPDAPIRLTFDAEKLALSVNADPADAPIAPNRDANIIGEPNANDPRLREWWRNTEGPPRFLRQPVVDARLDKDDIYRSVALNLDKRVAVVGSANFLRLVGFGEGPPKILCELPISEEAYRTNITPDGAIIVAGHSDGTLRWYRNSPTAEGCRLDLVLSAYIARAATGQWTWIAWTPSGEFANDPAALNLLTWQVVEADGAVKTVEFSQLLAWYKHDIVAGALAAARAAPITAEGPAARLPPALQQKILAAAGERILTIESKIDRTDRGTVAEPFRYRVRLGASESWPKRLVVKTGEGDRVLVVHSPPAPAEPLPELNVAKPGLVELNLALPQAARRSADAVDLCFYLDDRLQSCRAILWAGALEPPPPRRLWAVIVGVSKYDAPEMTLKYAQNDAIDFARSFIDNFEARREGRTTVEPPNFAGVNVDLVVSPTSPDVEGEMARLAERPYVKIRSATRDSILEALQAVVAKSEEEDLSGDLFLFYFSGHGLANPFGADKGLTLLATPKTSPDVLESNLAESTVSSDDLIRLLDRIAARKLVIIDACRNMPPTSRQKPFRAGALTDEFATRSLTTYFYFSTKDGHTSIEQPDFAVDGARAEGRRGNGLFTYGFLTALDSADADLPDEVASIGQIDSDEVIRYMRRNIFDLKNPESVAMRLRAARAGTSDQMPDYVEGRPAGVVSSRHLVLRTLR